MRAIKAYINCSCSHKMFSFFLFFFSFELVIRPGNLFRLQTVFAAHRLWACEFEPSDLYALREITLVGWLLLLFFTIGRVFGRK